MYYVLDDNKNLIEALSKEDVLGILEQAIEDGSLENIDEDTAVASKLRSIINGDVHHIEFVTQSQFNTLDQGGDLVAGTYYFITDDTSFEDLNQAIENISNQLSDFESGVRSGSVTAGNAGKINNVPIQKDENGVLIIQDAVTVLYQVDIGGELSEYDGIAYYEISGVSLYDGLILTYQNEQGTVRYIAGDGTYKIEVSNDGPFSQASGTTITTTSIENIVLPQRKKLIAKKVEFVGEYPSEIFTHSESLSNKTLEIKIENQYFKFKPLSYNIEDLGPKISYFYMSNKDNSTLQGSPHDYMDVDQYTIHFYLGAGGSNPDNCLLARYFGPITGAGRTVTKKFEIYEVIE